MDRDESEHLKIWSDWLARSTWESLAALNDRSRTPSGHCLSTEIAADALAKLPAVSAVDALAANWALVELLRMYRWRAMKAARDEGATWAVIGEALHMTHRAAHGYYTEAADDYDTKKVAAHGRYAARPHLTLVAGPRL